ncbi:MAG: universal stress protein [Dehalococcoidia bacterium]
MTALWLVAGWLAIVVGSMAIVAYVAPRWGRDPFGWALLAAAMGPFAIVGLIGTRQSDVRRAPAFELGDGAARRPAGERILAACDGSDISVELARHLAMTHADAEVLVLAVLPHESRPGADPASQADHDRRVEDMTAEALRVLRDANVPVREIVGYGSPGEVILRCADEERADVIAVGRRGSGLSRAMLGSVSDHVVKHATRPVVIVG